MGDFNTKPALQLKDGMILSGWILGLVLIGALCWFLTQPLRERVLLGAVNKVLEEAGDFRRLGESVSPGLSASFGAGAWFSMTQSERWARQVNQTEETSDRYFAAGARVFVFTFIGSGSFFPCAAVVSPDGKVMEFIPLGAYSQRLFKRSSPAVLDSYARRIEGNKS